LLAAQLDLVENQIEFLQESLQVLGAAIVDGVGMGQEDECPPPQRLRGHSLDD
jgi:hypothetical protein